MLKEARKQFSFYYIWADHQASETRPQIEVPAYMCMHVERSRDRTRGRRRWRRRKLRRPALDPDPTLEKLIKVANSVYHSSDQEAAPQQEMRNSPVKEDILTLYDKASWLHNLKETSATQLWDQMKGCIPFTAWFLPLLGPLLAILPLLIFGPCRLNLIFKFVSSRLQTWSSSRWWSRWTHL
ncbi:uncharacterized protein LOC119235894 isoform X2 [Talpa occidentalis]|uniref:uncharacterized protein LOC119235894 isoform X2 n=1 Tax=Talpa occidentalis TaxID=50954 RepID=UPI00188DCB00|nr:uncharacterized protein LOC119235894 isoform X2 [Talpa occidentalis]XP_037355380.1 uncharacterized protein LOC119235894 isoform X2 [Talpa occidentalis]XP_054547825.1 uncharacterized protein LOC119235894 isoform X2 [Talpa occidentalis]XP_054547826.1 uncharacterized protein LOC119235894 isoform X2 [Talpa occidentalis]XP_054547827.1 uncharacterized protein LOC119235894 isoform X2 [Talpa occidentalis]